jgi:mannose-6-phosphate isomerase
MEFIEVGERPWGKYFVVFLEEFYKIKKVLVYPDKRLSLQYHKFRQEHWLILTGKAKITVNDKEIILNAGESIDIDKQAIHRIQNISDVDLIFIEIQTGTYLGEDDIVRLEDDFNRVESN